ncbi:hypothetical protein MGYG_01617 [Nannizzia gypsea CBS 118893]|uniref:F-box domain-containing protein n=1 Tax=Arthroderma gypseum (strain ATCC MYA-4604 / CBS 118893) TaxID=535722 RepID=E5R1V7_ARTGP|nr:hypothetical protein MGYG_01617 [Nannizzia gypsea CBS 118893]EFQ98591.1 hypothetical protein MGYG_01617 [Nannizzia gypsea CBS 118893]
MNDTSEQLPEPSDRDPEWDTVSEYKDEVYLSSDDQLQEKESSRPPIHQINDDVLYYLANSILPLDDAAAFALTCRATYRATNGRRVLQRLEDRSALYRARFLERLELDFPDHVLCYVCGKFHGRLREGLLGLTSCDRNTNQLEYAPGFRYLYYRQIKEISNHYRLGPRYGRSEILILPQKPYFNRDAENNITHAVHISVKGINNAGNFELIIRRNSYVEYKYTNRNSRQEAIIACRCRSRHLWSYLKEEELVEEMLPSCYRCEMCGAERQYSISHLPAKPGYAVLRSTMWESVGQCENSGYGRLEHICTDAFQATVNQCLTIGQSELIHQRAFIDEMPAILVDGFHDSVIRNLTY